MSSELSSDGPRTESNEQEPLLGRPGDASQEDGQFIIWNLGLGTASIAQAGIWILAATVWACLFESPLNLFTAHPTANSAGLLLITQGILVLQPTHTPHQKALGTTFHFALNLTGLLALLAGLVVIEYNKISSNGEHWESAHGILGITTYVLLIIQGLVGFTQYYVPSLYGGVENAKKVWKYHRMSGYVVLTLGLATVCAATQTTYNKTLGIRLWVVLVASILVLAGLLPRVKLQKLGFKTG